jgi:hypothetical protein
MRVKWLHIFCVPLYFYVNMLHWSCAVWKYTINFKVNLYVSMFWQSTNFHLWRSMCQRPLLRTFTSWRRRQGNRKWSTVPKELFVSRCISEIRFFFWKPKVFTSAPPRALVLRHRNAPHVSRPVSQNFPRQFLGLPNGLLPYGPDQNCVWTSTPRPSRPSWEYRGRLNNCVARVHHLSPEALRPLFEILSGVVHECLEWGFKESGRPDH